MYFISPIQGLSISTASLVEAGPCSRGDGSSPSASAVHVQTPKSRAASEGFSSRQQEQMFTSGLGGFTFMNLDLKPQNPGQSHFEQY